MNVLINNSDTGVQLLGSHLDVYGQFLAVDGLDFMFLQKKED